MAEEQELGFISSSKSIEKKVSFHRHDSDPYWFYNA